MINTLISILAAIKDIYLSMVDSLTSFVETLIQVEQDINALCSMDSGSMVYQFIGHFRYLVGDVIYLGFWAVIIIGVNMMLFNLGRIALKAMDNGLAAKINFKFKP